MPPKNPNQQKGAASGSGGKSKNVNTQAKKEKEEAQEDPLQAVILADSYDSRFQPLTTSTQPRCLLPFLNAPLIDWTLESLSLAGVETVFILARNGLESIRKHVEVDLKHGLNLGFKIQIIPTPEARSIGDVMRELDSKQIIRTDFILCHADCVGNMDLEKVVKIHKERRLRDKDAIMTVCTMPVAKGSRTRSPGDQAIHFIYPSTSQLLHYETSTSSSKASSAKVPMELFLADPKDGGVSEIDMRNDLVEAGIDICSVDVPPLFSENFDYQSLRRDFVPGILTSDLLDSRIYVHIASSSPHANSSSLASGEGGWGYAARVKDTKSYDSISRDVLAKWTHPLTPGANCPGGIGYAVRNGSRYVGEGVRMSRSSTFGPSSLLGPSTILSDNSSVTQSVLGPNVNIGTNSKISGSYIWSDTKVGSNCTIEQSILGRNVTILDGVKIGRGSLIGDGCRIGPDVEVKAFSRTGRIEEKRAKILEDEEESESESESEPEKEETRPNSTSFLGEQSIGFLWSSIEDSLSKGEDSDSEDEPELEGEDARSLAIQRLGFSFSNLNLGKEDQEELESLSSIDGDSDLESGSDSEEGEEGDVSNAAALAGGALASVSQDTKLNEFKSEAIASLSRAFAEGHTVDNAAIELKTLRMASNVQLKEVRKVVIGFMLEKCQVENPNQLKELLDRWGGLIEVVAKDDQVEALALVQAYCAAHSTHSKLFVPLLKKFYNDDIVSDDSILSWWKSPISRDASAANGGEAMVELRKSAEGVVRHVLESQEDSEEEEEESD